MDFSQLSPEERAAIRNMATLYQLQTNFVAFASFTILVWDHFITFDDEVQYIWKGKKKRIHYLFLLNRYLTPLGFIVNLFAYLSPWWTPERCRHFVRYEGSMTIIGISVVALMMLERIHGLYLREPWVWRSVAALFLVMTAINAVLMTKGEPVLHDEAPNIKSCTMIFGDWPSAFPPVSAWFPLLYDTYVVILTLIKVYPRIRNKTPWVIYRRLFDDGIMYYSVILAITLTLAIMIARAPDGLKNITAQTELLITVTMMSRITLNLRKIAGQKEEERKRGQVTLTMPSRLDHSSVGIHLPPRAHPYHPGNQGHEIYTLDSLSSSDRDHHTNRIMVPASMVPTTAIRHSVIEMDFGRCGRIHEP